jgi:hypothetical protein
LKNIRAALTDGVIIEQRRQAIRYAKIRGQGQLADDFAGYVALYSLTHAKADIMDLWRNFFKSLFGGSDEYGKLKRAATLHPEQVDFVDGCGDFGGEENN